MDWSMILNAADARWRVVGLLYLCRERYAVEASEAGRLLALENGGAAYADELISEARKYALPGSPALNQGSWMADEEAVRYLRDLVVAYETPHRSWSLQRVKRLWRRFRTRHWPGFDRLPKITSGPTENN